MSGQYQTRVQRSGIHRSWSAIFEGQNQRRRLTPASASTPKITRPGTLEQPPSEASSGASGSGSGGGGVQGVKQRQASSPCDSNRAQTPPAPHAESSVQVAPKAPSRSAGSRHRPGAPSVVTQVSPEGHWASASQASRHSASGASVDTGAGGALVRNGRMKSPSSASTHTFTASARQATSPLTVSPTRTPSSASTGPPLSPTQLIPGAGPARKAAGSTLVTWSAPWRRRPDGAFTSFVSP